MPVPLNCGHVTLYPTFTDRVTPRPVRCWYCQCPVDMYQCKHCRAGPFESAAACEINNHADAVNHKADCISRVKFEEQKARDLERQKALEEDAANAEQKAKEASRLVSEIQDGIGGIDDADF